MPSNYYSSPEGVAYFLRLTGNMSPRWGLEYFLTSLLQIGRAYGAPIPEALPGTFLLD